MITDEMRDTERDPATSGCPAAGDRLDACRRRRCRRRRRRIVKAFGDKLGELFHPHDYRGNSRAQRRASAPTALAVAVAGESPPGTRRRAASAISAASRRHASPRTAIRPPTNLHASRRERNAPRCLSPLSPLLLFLSCRTLRALNPFREAGVLPLPPKPMLISICARRGNARGNYPSSSATGGRISFRRPSYHSPDPFPSLAFATKSHPFPFLFPFAACGRQGRCLPGDRERPRGN